MGKKTFYDFDHAYRYLVGCVIRYKDKPYVIQDAGPDRTVTGAVDATMICSPLGSSGGSKELRLLDDDVDTSPVSLGFCNYSVPRSNMNMAVRTQRVPQRMWKVGLHPKNLYTAGLTGSSAPSIAKLFSSTALRDCIMGVYPSFDKAVKMIEEAEEGSSVAISRHFAIDDSYRLYSLYEFKDVGLVDPKNGEPTFSHDKRYLKEQYEVESK